MTAKSHMCVAPISNRLWTGFAKVCTGSPFAFQSLSKTSLSKTQNSKGKFVQKGHIMFAVVMVQDTLSLSAITIEAGLQFHACKAAHQCLWRPHKVHAKAHRMPVGKCTKSIADSTLLTFWPPAPEALAVFICRSLGSNFTVTSSASGMIATLAVEVCTRPAPSVAGTRCTLCTPAAGASLES
jgi:hypothetical protein